MITWTKIESVPEAWKDGRHLLLWADGNAFVGAFDASISSGLPWGWADAYENGVRLEPTHFADITPPGVG